jgi:hypothetical protein
MQDVLLRLAEVQRQEAAAPLPVVPASTSTESAAAAAGVEPASVASKQPRSRLVVVANRLPISVTKNKEGEYSFKMSSGGLVSALVSVSADEGWRCAASFFALNHVLHFAHASQAGPRQAQVRVDRVVG